MTEINPTATLHAFDEFLVREGLYFSAVVIGGAALHVLGHITRTTDDVDVLVEGVLPQHRVTKLSPRPATAADFRRLFLDSMTIW